jgi:hypothetical protein
LVGGFLKMEQYQEIFEELEKIHSEIPQTKCDQKNECCKAGCPPMYYSEFLYLLENFNSQLDSDKKQKVINNCIDNYFSLDVIKPCPLFDGGCLVYDSRPVNCRIYGIIPNCKYVERRKRSSDQFTMSAKEMKEKMNLESIKDVPLYNQCDCVKIVKNNKEKSEKISTLVYDDIFKKLLEIEGKTLPKYNIKSTDLYYKTFHDHYLFKLVGETVLRKWTTIKMSIGNDPILTKDIVSKMKNNIRISSKGVLT